MQAQHRMNSRGRRQALCLTTAIVSSVWLAAAPALAQQAEAEIEEVVVTGTLIRGIAPAGANVISITRESIESSGVTDTQALLGTMPQSNTFMAFQNPGSNVAAGLARVPINLPNLRNLNAGSTGNQTTLVMMDGHRVVPMGSEQSAVDVSIIPTGILQNTETILDGASSLYGSDAHGGVINFITRKRFDETRAAARYGYADEYWSVDTNITSGKSWDTGGFGVTYEFEQNSALFNKDRSERITRNWTLPNTPLTGTTCEDHSTITAAGRTFNTSGTGVTSTVTPCPTSSQFASFVSAQERHGALASLSQDLGDTIKFEMTGLYSYRKATPYFGPFTATQTNVRSTNPYFRSLTAFGIPDTTAQSVAFSYGPLLGTDLSRGTSTIKMWQVTPELTVDVGEWQIRGTASYGRSWVTTLSQTLDSTLQGLMFAGTTAATTNNPYDIAASGNTAQIASLVYSSFRQGQHNFLQLRAIADGPLFTLPGGEVKGAVGAEYTNTKFTQIGTTAATHARTAPVSATQAPKSLFAEVNVPIVGADNARPLIQSLTLSASARWDDYQEYGDTFNPKVALTYEPIDWLRLRGNWGTSFRAPSAVNKLGGAINSIACITATGAEPGCANQASFVPLPPGSAAPTQGTVALSLIGANTGLRPETSDNWAIGADVRPIEGLTISPTYYHIAQKSVINIPSTGLNGAVDRIFLNAPHLVTLCPAATPANPQGCTSAQLDAVAAQAPTNGTTVVNLVRTSNYRVAYISDTRTTNLGGVDVSGLDLAVRYVHPFSWGTVTASFNGTWQLQQDDRFFETSVPTDALVGGSTFRSSTTLSATYGDLRGQVTWQHQGGYDLALPLAATRVPSQTSIKAYDLYNVSLRYNVDTDLPLLTGIQLTLTINNILDTQPHISFTTTGGTVNGSTLGRFVQFGVSKTF